MPLLTRLSIRGVCTVCDGTCRSKLSSAKPRSSASTMKRWGRVIFVVPMAFTGNNAKYLLPLGTRGMLDDCVVARCVSLA